MLVAAEKFDVFEKLEYEDSSYLSFFGAAGPPSTKDWDNVRSFMNFLKIFYDATNVFSSSLNVNLHNAFDELASVHEEIHNSAMNLNTILGSMAFEMKSKYNKYWGDSHNINELLYFGVILDPRCKLKYLEWSFIKMYESAALVNDVKVHLFELYYWYKSVNDEQNRTTHSFNGLSQGSKVAETFVQVETQSRLARKNAFRQHLREQDSLDRQNELETYLSEKKFEGDDKFDILVWWKQNSSQFPILSIMVKDMLATPVSTVASESTFSTRGRVLDTFRSSLNPEMAEALICAQNWLRSSLNQMKDINVLEELEISEKVLAECQIGTSFGSATGSFTVTDVVGCGPSSQSQSTTVGGD